jgi:hypothetical protein
MDLGLKDNAALVLAGGGGLGRVDGGLIAGIWK